MSRYVELNVTTHFSFLRGASSCEELFATAAMLDVPALGIVDRNSVAGMVRAWEAAKTTGVRLVPSCRLDLSCGTSLLVYPIDRPAWSRLTRLLSIGKGRAGKGACELRWEMATILAAALGAPLGMGKRRAPVPFVRFVSSRLAQDVGKLAWLADARRYARQHTHQQTHFCVSLAGNGGMIPDSFRRFSLELCFETKRLLDAPGHT